MMFKVSSILAAAMCLVLSAQGAIVSSGPTCDAQHASNTGCANVDTTSVSVHGSGTCVCIGNCTAVVPTGTCQPSGSLSVLLQGSNVVAYVPKGAWASSTTGVSVINIEGSSVTPTNIATADVINSCASNAMTGATVCTANNANVYIVNGNAVSGILASAANSNLGFSGGSCENCGVSVDATHNRALIGMGYNGHASFQFLDLNTNTFATPFASSQSEISEDPVLDPIRGLIISPTEGAGFEIVDVSNPAAPKFYAAPNPLTGVGGEPDSAAEDCATGIIFTGGEFTSPSQIFIADLKQATFTPGSPGTWSAASQVQTLTGSFLSAGPCGLAVAQGTYTGVIAGEFGGAAITAVKLPTTSGPGAGIPAFPDWVSCNIPGWNEGLDPHTLTAYQSSTGHAIGLFANEGATLVARVDLTALLDPTQVPRDGTGYVCASGNIPASIVTFISVP